MWGFFPPPQRYTAIAYAYMSPAPNFCMHAEQKATSLNIVFQNYFLLALFLVSVFFERIQNDGMRLGPRSGVTKGCCRRGCQPRLANLGIRPPLAQISVCRILQLEGVTRTAVLFPFAKCWEV